MRKRWRGLWLTVHRWLGLVAGLMFVLLGLTGSFLVFHHAIDAWLNPKMLQRGAASSSRSLEEIFAAARKVGEQDGKSLKFADAPRKPHDVWTVWFQGSEKGAEFHHVYVDPTTALVTGQRVRGEYLTSWIYKLHIELFAGRAGAILVGISGIALLVSLISGVYLWWPLWKHSWRSALAVRRGSRLIFDLHKVLGLISVPLLVVIAFSGVYMIFPDWFEPLGELVCGKVDAPRPPLVSQPSDDAVPISVDKAVAIGLGQLPGSELNRVYFPANEKGVYAIRMRQPEDVRRTMGSSRVWIEQYRGEVLAVRDWNEQSAADTFFAWQFPLHNGEAFGTGGRLMVFAAGWLPAILYGTGFWLWWRKGMSKRQRQQATRVTSVSQGSPTISRTQAVTHRDSTSLLS